MIFSIAFGLSGAAAALDNPQTPVCRKPEYPPESARRGEAGVTLVGFLVRVDGTVARSVILNSTGSPSLDQAAANSVSECRFRAGSKDGRPIEAWTEVTYSWSLSDDLNIVRVRRELAPAAKAGSAGAWYHLSLILSATAQTDADRQRALTLLESAAVHGHPHAQFQLGRRYEQGEGVEKDAAAALQWYEKAAAQGDVFAIERLKQG